MNPQKHFKLKLSHQAILLATFTAAYPVTGYCIAAGRVEFAIGNVESVSANGIRHLLGKGSEINAGDSISTAAGARAQLQFSDGGFISLQPGTLFRVDEYNYQNKTDGKERGFFSLLKGGFRAVTGFIGHLHKNSYQVTTAQATLGIRGTGYNMALRDDGLFVNVGEGAVSLSNKAGLLVVSAGNAAYVANFNTTPKLTTQLPLTPPNSLKEPDFTVADNRNSSGLASILPVLLSGSNYAMAYTYSGNLAAGVISAGAVGLPAPVAATFDTYGQLTQYSGATDTGSLGGGVVVSSASDGIIGWGRWTNSTITAGPASILTQPVPTFEYVVGIPTAVMPTTGAATYTLLGYVAPTATDGSSGYTVNGTLSANFGSSTVGVNMTVANASNGTYTIATGGTPLTIVGTNFAGTNIGTTNANPLSCPSGCSTSINGFFSGANAVRAGLSYSITAIVPGTTNLQGVAAFTR